MQVVQAARLLERCRVGRGPVAHEDSQVVEGRREAVLRRAPVQLLGVRVQRRVVRRYPVNE